MDVTTAIEQSALMLRSAAGADDRTSALIDLFDQEYTGLCRLVFVITGDACLAEDVVSEAFLRVFSRRWEVGDPGRFPAYLRRAAVNRARSVVRRRGPESRANLAEAGTASTAEGPADPGTQAVAHDQSGSVWRAVLDLPPRQRAAVVLRYYQDLSDDEIAFTMRCSPGTVRSQLFKARAALHRSLSPTMEER